MPGQAEADRLVVVDSVTKHFGPVTAVDDLSFTVQPGQVTGFLGPNGAGKTTTLRMLLGLVAPTRGSATICGRRYVELADPLRTVGAGLEATGFHAGRSARDHLRVLAATARIPAARIEEVQALVGLGEAASRRVGGFSLGMRQRLALAAALLGDPPVLLLDEPANGLDPQGIAWLRGFLRYLAGQGRTVLVSSHVLSEVQQTADEIVIIAHGRLVRQAPLAVLEGPPVAVVRAPEASRLATVLAGAGFSVDAAPGERDLLHVAGASTADVGRLAHQAAVEVHELYRRASALEEVFLSLTRDPDQPAGTQRSTAPQPSTPQPAAPEASS
jgi:ABC-2 type transport system ATP-binding protein